MRSPRLSHARPSRDESLRSCGDQPFATGSDRTTAFLVMMTIHLALFLAVSGSTPARVESGCAADSAYHVLDFWIGSWSVVDSSGAALGKNRIEKVVGGCAITESWTEPGSEGMSLFYYVPAQRQWKQVWVTPDALQPGGVKEKHLISAATGMVRFQGEIIGPRGGLILDRTTLTALDGGRVRQVIEISRDGGTTWRTTFEGIYRK